MGVAQAVVRGIRLVVQIEFRVLPVEVAGVDDDSADPGAVAAEPFGERMNDDVGPVLDRPQETGRSEGRIDDERQLVFLGNLRQHLDIRHVDGRIAEGLAVDRPGLAVDRRFHLVRLPDIDQADLDAQLGQNGVELDEGAAVQVVGRNNFVALAADIDDSIKNRRSAGGECQCRGPAFEACHALFENVLGGIADPGVDVAEFLQAEEVGGMFGVPEEIGGGPVYGHGPREGGRVDGLSGMQGKCFEFHVHLLFC